MPLTARAFVNPLITVAVLAIAGLAALVLQAIFERYPSFALSEALFLLFACISAYVGSFVSSQTLPRLHAVERHLGGRSSSEGDRGLPSVIERHEWHAIGVLGVLVGMAAVYTHDVAGIPWSGFLRFIYFVSVFLNFWVVGAVLAMYGLALVWLYRLANQEARIEPFAWQPDVVSAAANVYLVVTLFGVGLYLLGLLAIWVSPGGRIFFAEGALVRQLWIIPIALCVAGYFCLTQFLVHRVVQNAKRSRLAYLRARRDEAFKNWEEAHRTDDAEVVEFLTRAIDDVSKEGTWLLNLPKLLSILIPIFAPAANQILQLFTAIFSGNS